MDFNQIARELIPLLGGKENIASAAHCATRLRLVLVDDALAAILVGEAHVLERNLAARDGQRIYPANVFPVVPGLRVVDLVHADGVGVMVDGDVHMPADGLLDACTGTTATGKEVDHQLCRD